MNCIIRSQYASFLILLLLRATCNARTLRRASNNRASQQTILCRITVVHTSAWDEDYDLQRDAQTYCIPIIHRVESENMYSVSLPNDLSDQYVNDIVRGSFYVSISNAVVVNNGIILAEESEFKPFPAFGREGSVENKAIGSKTITAVRVSLLDSEPSFSKEELAETLFSTDRTNLVTQFDACSFGQLRYTLAKDGILELLVEKHLADYSNPSDLVDDAQVAILEKLGIDASTLADTVLMCLPPGILREGKVWFASAPVNHWRAQFNDNWSLSLSTTMHEIGHLLGLLHSNMDGVEYNDISGYMGSGLPSSTYPRKCYNGAENWQLGWYTGRTLSIDPMKDAPQYVNLAAFTDYDIAAPDEPVLINLIDKYFIQYNLAEKFNNETEAKQNQTVITELDVGGTNSLAGLNPGDEYKITNFNNSGKDLVIAACDIKAGNDHEADLMYLSIAFDSSNCGAVLGSQKRDHVTNAPTMISTPSPTGKLTHAPTSHPTHKPTHAPTSKPTNSPTEKPTASPTSPTTASPTISPTNAVTPAPTTAATPAATVVTTSDVPKATPDENGNCDVNLLQNSDMEEDIFQYWMKGGAGSLGVDTGVDGTKALRYSGRNKGSDGPIYRTWKYLDTSCLKPATILEFVGDFKLFDSKKEEYVSCTPHNTCPSVSVNLLDAAGHVIIKKDLRGYALPTGEWITEEFNRFRKSFLLPQDWDGSVEAFHIQIHDCDPDWDIIVDNFRLRKATYGSNDLFPWSS